MILVRYLTAGLKTRQGKGKLLNALKLALYRSSLDLGPKNSKYINLWSNKTLVHKVMPLMYKNLIVDLPGYGEQFDAQSMWLVKLETQTPQSSVIVFLHGGGYFLQTQPMQLAMMCTLYKLVSKAARANINILFLDYKLVSEGKYPLPYQVNQLYESYANLVNAGYENITLLGDSAGGNMAICFSQYLYMLYNNLPDPSMRPVTKISKQIYPSQLILISPWVRILPEISDIYTPGNSWHDNEQHDLITHHLGDHIRDIISTAKLENLLVSPGNVKTVPADWLRIPVFSDPKLKIFVLFGEDESFRDDIITWCNTALGVPLEHFRSEPCELKYALSLKEEKPHCQIEVHMEPYGLHDAFFFFEDVAAVELKRKKSLDISKYYGLSRIVDFINSSYE